MPRLSVVIITLNEEKNIERCLLSIKDVADEILIVDSYSTDRTEEICAKYNAHFIQHKFEGYIEQKNWATSQARYNYVLALDADEALSDELKNSILKVKENWNADGYSFNRLTSYCGRWIRHTSWYPSRKLRLWDRRKGRWDGLNPHDRFEMVRGAVIKKINGDLLHYSYYSISEQIQQINRFTDIIAKAYQQRGVNSTLWHILFRPFWRFFRDYFIKLGMLDGLYGFIISLNGAFEVYLKYLKLRKNIENESLKEPFRFCFLSTESQFSEREKWILDNVQNLEQKGVDSFLLSGSKTMLVQESKLSRIKFITVPINKVLYLNPISLLRMSRIIKQMRVRSIVVTNIFDAKVAAVCSRFAGNPDVFYLYNENDDIKENALTRYLFEHLIDKIFIRSNAQDYDKRLIHPDKIAILKEENNFEIEKKHYSKEVKVLISLDKINKPNCGLGRVAIDFSKALINAQDESSELTYILYGNNNFQFFGNQHVKHLNFINRLVPAYFGKYDVLHKLHQSPSFSISGSKKTVLTIHDLNFLFTKSKSKAERYLKEVQRNVDHANAVVFISNFTKDICMQHLHISSDKIIKVIYNGVEMPNCLPQKPKYIGEDMFLFSIGQFLAKKNFHVLIPFLEKLPANMKLVVAGENNTVYGSQMRKAISASGMSNRVILPGPISEEEKLYLYQNCKAFVFPSLYEGFGLPIIEAMRAGKPVFCSDKTSLKEIGDKYVYFWDAFESERMYDVYKKGISDFNDDKRKDAYNYSLQYTWEKNADEYLKLYKSMIAHA